MRDYRQFLTRVSLVAGPLLLAASTFFWTDGRYGATGGTLLVLAMPFWAYGIVALLDRMSAQLPRYAAAALLLGLLGAVGGAAFGFQGFFEAVYGLDKDASLTALERYPVISWILLWGLGPLFPAAVFALGAGLARTRQLPRGLAILVCAGAVLFPLSRVPRAEWVAHLIDLMIVVPFLVAAARWREQPGHPVQDDGGTRGSRG
jgi:hypothetical protein